MLVGRARRSTHENPMTELIARMSTAPPSPRTINPEIPESISAIVDKLIDPNADNRYQSTRDLVLALNRLAPDGSIKSDVHEVIVHDAPARSKLAAAAIIIVLVGGVAGWMVSNRGPVVSAAHDPVSVLIGDIENKTGDAVFDGVVEQALTLGIEGASFINAFPRRDALRAATAINKTKTKLDEETARLVAFRENLGVAIVGAVEKKGAGYHISIKGLDPAPDGQEKFSINDDAASKGAVLETVAKMAAIVRTQLGDTVAPAASDAFTAANLDAVRAYAKGQELFATGKFDEAIAAYIEATKFDPEFGRGYSSAATAANNANKRDQAQKYYDLAMQKLDRMTDREKFRTRGQFYLFSRNPTAAIDQFKELVEKYPSDVQGMSNLANAHSQLREFDQAMAMGDRVAAMFPKNPLRQNNAALYAMYAGKFTEAIAKGKIASDLNREYGLAWLSQGLAAEALGNYADAEAAYKQLATINGSQARAALGTADLAMLRGRISEASAALEPMLALQPPQQLTRVQTTLAAVRLAQGRVADAIKLAEDALKVAANPDAITRYEAGRIFAAAGRTPRAKEMASELDKSLVLETRALGLTLLGEIQLIENDVRGAVATLQQSLKIADTWMTHYLLGRAYLLGQDFQLADTEFDKCESRKGEATAVYIDDLPTWRLMAPLYYYTGLTRSALKRPTAADAFRTFVELKKGGDEKSSLVTDAERRLSQ
jgi:tetratricopeptide (TPR) repeat protein